MITPPSDPRRALRAIGLLLLAIVCFDLMAVLVRVLSVRYSALELSAYRNVLGVIPSLALLVATGELRLRGSNLRIEKWPLAVLRGLAVAVAQVCFYSALGVLELATVSALGQTNAMFVVILSVLLLGERVGPWRIAALVVGFLGALWIIRPGGEAFSVHALLPVGAAVCYAFSMISVRFFGPGTSNALLYLYSSLAAALGAIAMAAVTTEFTPLQSVGDAALIFVMSILGGTGVLFMMLAYRMGEPSLLAPFNYFGLISAFSLGWLFFGEAPVDTLFPGVLLIVAAGVLILWRENRRST
ncbi:EamA domain-containing membrane protein RarD [Lutimaribacter pacificus]|uniref:EamA domain-containing membrane protein RarD n=1 Tax=Lutimaribacter pacificus TaxID=391948 RepID=A0A1H0F5D6_9RHOB|nr:DMT family transporter [Lutimaribacter pacificus]SDN89803.1 EamA domain-containing membrane protein RarD [Lutimaribacter pacificus]SHK45005.1 EamA domain-containing membrane protein RarD [Lutimaribacter pacificus]